MISHEEIYARDSFAVVVGGEMLKFHSLVLCSNRPEGQRPTLELGREQTHEGNGLGFRSGAYPAGPVKGAVCDHGALSLADPNSRVE